MAPVSKKRKRAASPPAEEPAAPPPRRTRRSTRQSPDAPARGADEAGAAATGAASPPRVSKAAGKATGKRASVRKRKREEDEEPVVAEEKQMKKARATSAPEVVKGGAEAQRAENTVQGEVAPVEEARETGDGPPSNDASTAVGVAQTQEEEEEEEEAVEMMGAPTMPQVPAVCPYLDTINRTVLDFDMERVCSVSLQPHNVYCCLVCGVYLQGRAPASMAYRHSFDSDHHVFINLDTLKVYCLPDGYEVRDPSLSDIRAQVCPVFTPGIVQQLDTEAAPHLSLDQREYHAGIVGLNNVKANDYINAVVMALAHVPRLRDHMLLASPGDLRTPLLSKFAAFLRKVWNPQLFRPHVSPHELLSAIHSASRGRFRREKQSDAQHFLAWLLHTLHKDMGGGHSVIHQCFQGRVQVRTRPLPAQPGVEEQAKDMPFLMLALELPQVPANKNEQMLTEKETVIPTVPIFDLLQKFDGTTVVEDPLRGESRRYRVRVLPEYLIVHLRRFVKNQFYTEKNATIVPFPVLALDMAPYTSAAHTANARYNLVANVVHDGKAVVGAESEGMYKVHVQHAPSRTWFECHDLRTRQVPAQMIAVSESFLLVYKRE